MEFPFKVSLEILSPKDWGIHLPITSPVVEAERQMT
jgi:hypothetical protein